MHSKARLRHLAQRVFDSEVELRRSLNQSRPQQLRWRPPLTLH